MKVKVTRQDIAKGRNSASFTCGCPIHRALGRKLKVPVDPEIQRNNVLLIPNWSEALLGKIRIPLPEEARVFQEKLMNDVDAKVRPFEFETELVAPR